MGTIKCKTIPGCCIGYFYIVDSHIYHRTWLRPTGTTGSECNYNYPGTFNPIANGASVIGNGNSMSVAGIYHGWAAQHKPPSGSCFSRNTGHLPSHGSRIIAGGIYRIRYAVGICGISAIIGFALLFTTAYSKAQN